MKERKMTLYHQLPVPASDFSGALSALYSLQGMYILCSPGSCARSYVDFDEFRPFNEKLYTTKMKMVRVISGTEDICDSVCSSHHKKDIPFIALIGTAVPSVVGMDIPAAAARIERQLNIPTICIECDGFHSYTEGVSKALLALGKRMLEKQACKMKGVNLIGYNPFCHGPPQQLDGVRSVIEGCGIQMVCDWSTISRLEDMAGSTNASLNLVLSSSGIALAEYMKKEYHIPYELICPAGRHGLYRLEHILHLWFGSELPELPAQKSNLCEHNKIAVAIGEPLMAKAINETLRHDFGVEKTVSVFCDPSPANRKLQEKFPDIQYMDQKKLIHMLLNLPEQSIVAGDPLYGRFVSKSIPFIEIPDHGVSGNLYASPRWVGEDGIENIKAQFKEKIS